VGGIPPLPLQVRGSERERPQGAASIWDMGPVGAFSSFIKGFATLLKFNRVVVVVVVCVRVCVCVGGSLAPAMRGWGRKGAASKGRSYTSR
jgi:hypothetical protein